MSLFPMTDIRVLPPYNSVRMKVHRILPVMIDSKGNSIQTDTMRKMVKAVIFTWLTVSILFLHYVSLRLFRMFFNSPIDTWLIGNTSVYTVSAITLDTLLYKREQIKKTFKYVTNKALGASTNSNKLRLKWKICAIVTLVYVLLMIFIAIAMSQIKCHSSKSVTNWWVRMIFFGCDFATKWSWRVKCVLMATDNLLCGVCLMGCCPVLALGSIVLSTSLSDLMESFISYIEAARSEEFQMNFNNVREMRRKHQDILNTVDGINDTYKYFLLVWTMVAVESACFAITVCLKKYGTESFENAGSSLYYISKYGQPIFIFVVVNMFAASIPDKCVRACKVFRELTVDKTPSDRDGCQYHTELVVFLDQLENSVVGVSVGGCFLLTRNFCLSFLGLGATYVVILIQLQDVSPIPNLRN